MKMKLTALLKKMDDLPPYEVRVSKRRDAAGDHELEIWRKDGNGRIACICSDTDEHDECARNNAAYLTHCANALTELVKAFETTELSCTQARLANGVGKKSKGQQVDFLLSSLNLIAVEARAALAKASEVEVPS